MPSTIPENAPNRIQGVHTNLPFEKSFILHENCSNGFGEHLFSNVYSIWDVQLLWSPGNDHHQKCYSYCKHNTTFVDSVLVLLRPTQCLQQFTKTRKVMKYHRLNELIIICLQQEYSKASFYAIIVPQKNIAQNEIAQIEVSIIQ